MVFVRSDPNAPITFSGQLSAYDSGYTYDERFMRYTDQRVITAPNPNPITDTFYENLATGALPLRETPSTDNKIRFVTVGTTTNPQMIRPEQETNIVG
jgi:hypothetical protein